MSANEQKYYELLARTDHPVFERDLSTITNSESPFNSIINRLIAIQLDRFKSDLDEVTLNCFPDTITDLSIDRWEYTYFGFVKLNKTLSDRKTDLLTKINNRIGMSVNDVITTSRIITGKTPFVIRSVYFSGWILDSSELDFNTALSGSSSSDDVQTYVVIFSEAIDSFLMSKLDAELFKIEKGGSIHKIIAPVNFWVLDENTLDIDTIMGL